MAKDARKRYSTTDRFAPQPGRHDDFRGLMPRQVLPKNGYIEHELKVADRLDTLALSYYGDPRLWWVIAQANPGTFFAVDLVYEPSSAKVHESPANVAAGTIILIPAKPGGPV